MRKAFTVLGALAMALAVVAPAQASDIGTAASCGGSETYKASVGGVGQLKIFYSGGSNNACFYHIGAAAGKAAETFVDIYKCTETSGEGQAGCTFSQYDSDGPGNWQSYAGPATVTGTANVCVLATGYIKWGGKIHEVYSGRQGCPRP
ncbi:hypothetical protein GCM10011609_12410 [Lentzea pudingi]|uniref:Secreted protein n=1 Tax=Lentzea pudingi TaxID=1789439 RepID=A0ABQ2HFD3_9PSEU|nr:hypothetical protein [Lentzea pudingi]GGM78150.1 hypothetical protein GCM10011609_12410 [Lentzea pudingi]